MMNNEYTQDREDAIVRIKNASKVLTWLGMPDYTEGWNGGAIGRSTNENNISVQDMNAAELDKLYDTMYGLFDSLKDFMDELNNLAEITRLCEKEG